MTRNLKTITVWMLLSVFVAPAGAGTKVSFNSEGTCLIDGMPFFPIGIWVYSLDAGVMADLHEHHFNTIVGVGFKPEDVPLIEEHGMMIIPTPMEGFLARKHSPALLGWYLQ